MAEIALEGIEFKGYHGLYPAEKANGNTFVLDIRAFSPPDRDGFAVVASALGSQWPDYSRIYALAERVFVQPRNLLEEVVTAILMALHQEWPDWTYEVSLSKMNPPITRSEGHESIRIPKSKITMRCSELGA